MPRIESLRISSPFAIEILNLPPTARLIVLLGRNGSGKSSILGGLNILAQIPPMQLPAMRPPITFHGGATRSNVYARTAYRTTHLFDKANITAGIQPRPTSFSASDQQLPKNYSDLQAAILKLCKNSRVHDWTEAEKSLLSDFRQRLSSLLPWLTLDPVLERDATSASLPLALRRYSGNPYSYSQLSSGEKEIFDLLFDLSLSHGQFPDAIYCIDEPELHVHTALQGPLLRSLFEFITGQNQLWIATHSIGMIREAFTLHQMVPGEVVFLDCDNASRNGELQPAKVNRDLWKTALSVTLHDMSGLVCPTEVIICEGRPKSLGAVGKPKITDFDSEVYSKIFREHYPNTEFISGGNCKDVQGDALKLAAGLSKLLSSVRITTLIDRDNKSLSTVMKIRARNRRVLSMYSIESYLWSDEVIRLAMQSAGASHQEQQRLLDLKRTHLGRTPGDPEQDVDCIKDIDHLLWEQMKNIPAFRGMGENANEFAKEVLAEFIKPGTVVYADLEQDIFK